MRTCFVSGPEEDYPVYSMSEIKDDEHEHAVSLTDPEIERINKAFKEFSWAQEILGSASQKYIPL